MLEPLKKRFKSFVLRDEATLELALGATGRMQLPDGNWMTIHARELTADGKLRPCLFSDLEFDVRDALRAGDEARVRELIGEALLRKPESHHDRAVNDRMMSQIGG